LLSPAGVIVTVVTGTVIQIIRIIQLHLIWYVAPEKFTYFNLQYLLHCCH
jgi:hypothetical protein